MRGESAGCLEGRAVLTLSGGGGGRERKKNNKMNTFGGKEKGKKNNKMNTVGILKGAVWVWSRTLQTRVRKRWIEGIIEDTFKNLTRHK